MSNVHTHTQHVASQNFVSKKTHKKLQRLPNENVKRKKETTRSLCFASFILVAAFNVARFMEPFSFFSSS